MFVSFFSKCPGGHVIYKREGKQILLRVSAVELSAGVRVNEGKITVNV